MRLPSAGVVVTEKSRHEITQRKSLSGEIGMFGQSAVHLLKQAFRATGGEAAD